MHENTMLVVTIFNIEHMLMFFKLTHRFNEIPIKIPAGIKEERKYNIGGLGFYFRKLGKEEQILIKISRRNNKEWKSITWKIGKQ